MERRRFWGIEELPRHEFFILNVKGRQYEYSELLWMVNSIELSSNILSGEIPQQIVGVGVLDITTPTPLCSWE